MSTTTPPPTGTSHKPTGPTRDQVLSALNLEAEAIALGIEFAGQPANSQGWRACYRLGGDDRNPSAGFNVQTGQYKEFAGESDDRSISIFDLWNRKNGGGFREAIAYYKEKAGLGDKKRATRPKPQHATLTDAIKARLGQIQWKERAPVEVALNDAYRFADGSIAFHIVRFECQNGSKSIRPFSPVGGKWVEESIKAPRPLFRLPEIAHHRDMIVLVEGEKCCHRLDSIGVFATTSAHGSKSAAQTDWTPLRGREVAILPDNDDEGLGYAHKVVGILHQCDPPAKVKVVEIPGLGPKDDVADWIVLRRGDGLADDEIRGELLSLIAAARWAEPPRREALRAKIICGSEAETEGLKTWTPQALDALGKVNDPPRIFQRGSSLARIKDGGEDSPPTLEALSIDALRGELDRCAAWGSTYTTRTGETKVKYGPPRMDVVRDLASLPSWDRKTIPEIEGIIETPRFLPGGRLVLDPGYHADCRLFYSPGEGLEGLTVPDRPNEDQVIAARQLLLDDLLVDFSFANQASRAAAVALTLLPFVRPMINDATPLHHIGAACEGTGKSLLAAACCYPSLGREVDTTVQKESEAEWRKALTTAFMRGDSHICLDNLYNPLGWDDTPLSIDSGTLAAALTARHFNDRKLGGNETARLKVSTVFLSTGNNVMFSRELTRRIVPIDLIAPIENPSLRTGFKHDPLLLEFVIPNRRRILEACLTLCRYWVSKGCPTGRQVMGRYESYARTMGGLLDCIEVYGFLSNRAKLIGRNSEARRWSALVEAWRGGHGINPVSTGQLWEMIKNNGDLGVAFADILGSGSDLSQKQRLGKAIEKQCNQVWGEMRITRSAVKLRSGVAVYVLKDASEPYQDDYVEEEAEEGGSDDVPF